MAIETACVCLFVPGTVVTTTLRGVQNVIAARLQNRHLQTKMAVSSDLQNTVITTKGWRLIVVCTLYVCLHLIMHGTNGQYRTPNPIVWCTIKCNCVCLFFQMLFCLLMSRLKTAFLMTSDIGHVHVAMFQCLAKLANFSARWSVRMVCVKNYKEILYNFVKVTHRIL